MSGVRIYDLAKELNVPNNEILDMLKAMGEPARTASSTLPDALIATVRERVKPVSAAGDGAVKSSNGTAAASNGTAAPVAALAVAAPSAAPVEIPEVITLKDFAQLIGIPAPDIQKKLMGLGVLASLNQKLSPEVTSRLAKSYKVAITVGSAPKPAASNGAVPDAPPAPPKVAVVPTKPRQKAAGPVVEPPFAAAPSDFSRMVVRPPALLPGDGLLSMLMRARAV